MMAARCSLLAARCSLLALTLSPSRAQDHIGAWVDSYVHPNANSPAGWGSASKNWIHLAVIPNSNDVIVWDRDSANQQVAGGWLQRYSVGNPETHAFTNGIWTMPVGFGDLFCAGHTWLPDGRLFVAGGTTRYPTQGADYHRGSKFVGIWDPVTSAWNSGLWGRLTTPAFPNPHSTVAMSVERWYPTVMLVSRTRVLVAGGSQDTRASFCSTNQAGLLQDGAWDTYEVFDLTQMDWERTSQAAPPTQYDGPAYNTSAGGTTPSYVCGGTSGGQPLQYSRFGEYGRMHWVTSGELVLAGESQWATRWRHDPLTVPQTTSALPQTPWSIGAMARS